MTENKLKRIFADVDLAKANQFLAQAKLKGTSAQELISDFIDRSLGHVEKPYVDPATKHRQWVDRLVAILEEGDRQKISIVTGVLTLWGERQAKSSKKANLA